MRLIFITELKQNSKSNASKNGRVNVNKKELRNKLLDFWKVILDDN